jgi:hypothetical protein
VSGIKSITVHTLGNTYKAKRPHATADYVVIRTCPKCEVEPCRVQGGGVTHHDHDTYFSRAICLACEADIGEIRTKVETMFGIEEDNAVLNGRCRVYGGDS